MLNEDDIIDCWKHTRVAWTFVPQEMKDWAMNHKQHMVRLSIISGEFTEKVQEFKAGYVYQLKQDYVEDSGFIEVPIVKINALLVISGAYSNYCYYTASTMLEWERVPVKFAGFKYENGNGTYSTQPYLPKGGSFSVSPLELEYPTHVVFKKI